MSVSPVDPDKLEDALNDCEAAVLFLSLAIDAVFDPPGRSEPSKPRGNARTFLISDDEISAILWAKTQVFGAVREAGQAFGGIYTLGVR